MLAYVICKKAACIDAAFRFFSVLYQLSLPIISCIVVISWSASSGFASQRICFVSSNSCGFSGVSMLAISTGVRSPARRRTRRTSSPKRPEGQGTGSRSRIPSWPSLPMLWPRRARGPPHDLRPAGNAGRFEPDHSSLRPAKGACLCLTAAFGPGEGQLQGWRKLGGA